MSMIAGCIAASLVVDHTAVMQATHMSPDQQGRVGRHVPPHWIALQLLWGSMARKTGIRVRKLWPVLRVTWTIGYQCHLKNELIRQYVPPSPRALLFDYADILCWGNSGAERMITW